MFAGTYELHYINEEPREFCELHCLTTLARRIHYCRVTLPVLAGDY
jgi:hypothetical protein